MPLLGAFAPQMPIVSGPSCWCVLATSTKSTSELGETSPRIVSISFLKYPIRSTDTIATRLPLRSTTTPRAQSRSW